VNDRDLEGLPLLDVSPEAAARTRRRALHAFEEESALEKQPRLLAMIHRGSRAAFPVVVVAGVCVYLGWAIQAASALY
jgi:hypothetical protein